MPQPRKFPWEKIKTDYIEGIKLADGSLSFPSPVELAERHGMPRASDIRARAAREGWNDQRAIFKSRLDRIRQGEKLQSIAREAADFDSRALRTARIALSMIAIRFGEIMRDAAALRRRRAEAAYASQQDGNAAADAGPAFGATAIDSLELQRLALALATFHRIGREALGDAPAQALDVRANVSLPEQYRRVLSDPEARKLAGALAAKLTSRPADLNGNGIH